MSKQPIVLVAAMSCDRVIGYQNKLPWHMPADLRYFREVTQGKTVIMGRKTFDSMGQKKLPNRRNIIVTRHPADLSHSHCEIAESLEEALRKAQETPSEIMVIGGQTLYEQALDKATHIYLTLIDAHIQGDTFFPKWEKDEWEEIEKIQHKADQENPYDYCFLKLKRIKPSMSA